MMSKTRAREESAFVNAIGPQPSCVPRCIIVWFRFNKVVGNTLFVVLEYTDTGTGQAAAIKKKLIITITI